MDREAVDGPQVVGGQLVGRPQLDLRLHVGQIDFGGKGAGAVVALLGLLDEVVWRTDNRSPSACGGRIPHNKYRISWTISRYLFPTLQMLLYTDAANLGIILACRGRCSRMCKSETTRRGDAKKTGFKLNF